MTNARNKEEIGILLDNTNLPVLEVKTAKNYARSKVMLPSAGRWNACFAASRTARRKSLGSEHEGAGIHSG